MNAVFEFIINTPLEVLLIIALAIGGFIGNADANRTYKEVFGYWPSERHKHRWKSQTEREQEEKEKNDRL